MKSNHYLGRLNGLKFHEECIDYKHQKEFDKQKKEKDFIDKLKGLPFKVVDFFEGIFSKMEYFTTDYSPMTDIEIIKKDSWLDEENEGTDSMTGRDGYDIAGSGHTVATYFHCDYEGTRVNLVSPEMSSSEMDVLYKDSEKHGKNNREYSSISTEDRLNFFKKKGMKKSLLSKLKDKLDGLGK